MKKKNNPKARLQYFLLLLLLVSPGMNKTYGQSWVTANIGNTPVGAITSSYIIIPAAGMSSANINYQASCVSCMPSGELNAVAWAENTSPIVGAKVFVDDGLLSYVSVSIAGATCADVILGNNTDVTSPNYPNDYLMGVVYIVAGTVKLNIYSISPPTGIGLSTPSLVFGPQTISAVNTGARNAHIDIIADYSTLFPGSGTQYQLCDKFVIGWSEASNMRVYESSLNHPSSTSGIKTLSTAAPSVGFYYMDVAGITRTVSGNQDDMALVTYEDNGILYYQEYDFGTTTSGSQTLLNNVLGLKVPRIDAIDNYNINDPTIVNPLADWMVTAFKPSGEIYQFSNLNLTGTDISSALLSGNIQYFPTVAMGPDTQYTVMYNTDYNTYDYATQNVGWTMGTVANNNYYEVPKNAASSGYASTVTGSCNTNGLVPQDMYFFWEDNGTVYEKSSLDPFSFKPALVGHTNKQEGWLAGPNPAMEYLQITAPRDVIGASYVLQDVSGRELRQGKIKNVTERVEIGQLAVGFYILHLYERTKEVRALKIVKE